MSTNETKKCPLVVLELKQKRSREKGKLSSLIQRVHKKLVEASAGEGQPPQRPDVTAAAAAGQSRLPYYLLQPKAKASKPPYLGSNEVIILRDEQGWRKGRLTKHTGKYKNSGYEWGYYTEPADPADEGDADEHWAFLEPGLEWGVLRGVDTELDLSKLELLLSDGPQLPHTITSTCEACNGGEIKVFKEEVQYLRSQLPFKCFHSRRITDFQPGSSAEGPTLWTPRPGYPLLPRSGTGLDATARLAAPSTLASTVDAARINLRVKDVEDQLLKLVDAHSDLEDAIRNCNLGDITGFEELEKERMDGYLLPLQEEVDELQDRAQQAVEDIDRLADFEGEEEDGRPAGAKQQELVQQQEEQRRQEGLVQQQEEHRRQGGLVQQQEEHRRQEGLVQQQEQRRREELVQDLRRQGELDQQQEELRRQQERAKQEEIQHQEELQRQEQLRRQEEIQHQEELRRRKAARQQEELQRQEELLRQGQIQHQEELRRLKAARPQEEPERQEERRRQEASRRQVAASRPTPSLLEPLVFRSSFARSASCSEEFMPLGSPTVRSGSPARSSRASPPRSSSAASFQQALSPESRQALQMKRSRLEKEKQEIEDTLTEYEAQGSSKFKARTVDMAITEVEKLLTDILAELGLQLRARNFPPSSSPAKERAQLYDDMYTWLRLARRRNWAAVSEAEPPVVQQSLPGSGAAHLERARLPKFDGKPENYFEFKRRFQELVKTVKCSPVLEMTYLVDHLAVEAAKYVRGIREPVKAWAQLDKRYGDRRLAIMTARHHLSSAKLPKGPAHDQVEALVQELRLAKDCLEAVQAEDELFTDTAMIGTLLGKLPQTVRTKWYGHRVTLPAASALEDGRIFEQWLDKEGEAATLERITILQSELGHGHGAPPAPPALEKQACGRCHRPGHHANSCPPDPPLRDQPPGTRRAENFSVESHRPKLRYASKEEAEEEAARRTARTDPCPACRGAHSFTRRFNSGAFTASWPSVRLESCPEFVKLSPSQRATMVEAQGGCCLCTAFTHRQDRCFASTMSAQSWWAPRSAASATTPSSTAVTARTARPSRSPSPPPAPPRHSPPAWRQPCPGQAASLSCWRRLWPHPAAPTPPPPS